MGRLITEIKFFEIKEDIVLDNGGAFSPCTIAYETIGELNKDKSNAILIFHALSGNSHVAGHYSENDSKAGWWDLFVGSGKAIDTDKYFVICANVIGGCGGSTGPSSINPKTNRHYAADFPVITISDMLKPQKKLVDFLGIKKLLAVIGGSMGGMQALQWSINYPGSAKLVVSIAAAVRQSAQNIAFHETGRQVITTDPNWNHGDYYDKNIPKHGLSVARMLSHITYMSEKSMKEKFGRRLQDKDKLGYCFDVEFQVESYLKHQGSSFVDRFDANSYLYITKAIDYFDLTEGGTRTLGEVFSNTGAKFLILSFTSDWLYTTEDSKELVRALQQNSLDVAFIEIESDYGHDSFLLENRMQKAILERVLANEI